MVRHLRPTWIPAGSGGRGQASRRLGVEPLEPRALLAAFPLPLTPVDPLGSLVYTGFASGVHGVEASAESFESAELPAGWTATSSQTGGQVRVTGELGTAAGDGALIMEFEDEGTLFAAAQDIDAAGWSRDFDGDIGDSTTRPHVTIEGDGDGTFDYFRFTVANPGDVGTFDIDDTSFLDAHLRLYDPAGRVISQNDDNDTSLGGAGSDTSLDSFLRYPFRVPGVYAIEVGSCCVGPVFSGSYTLHVSLDDHPLGETSEEAVEAEPNQPGDNLNEAVWTVDLDGVTDALLRFSHANFGDELDFFPGDFEGSAMADGAAISDDGIRWHPVFIPFQGPGDWHEHVIDLSAEAAVAGMELGPGFQIKFQHFSDGGARGWDDIAIVVPGDDMDSFEIAVEPGQVLTFDVAPLVGSLQPAIDVYAVSDEAAELLGTATADGVGQAAILQTLATAPGAQTYRIDVRGMAGVGTFGVRLVLNAAVEEESRGRGDNGTRQTSQALALTPIGLPPDNPASGVARAAVLGLLDPDLAGSGDYYSFHLEAGDTVAANLTLADAFPGGGGGTADLLLLDADGQALVAAGGGATNVDRAIADFVAPLAGTYYLRVTGGQQASYSLIVMRNAAFELEGNSTFENALDVPGPFGGQGRWVAASRRAADDFPPVGEAEPNDPLGAFSLESAQDIDESGWTRAEHEDIAESETRPHLSILGSGDNTLDFFRFTVPNAGDVGVFDIDSTIGFNSHLRLFDANGTQLAVSDDSDIGDGAAGSGSTLDSYLEFTFPAPGEYVIEVGSCCGPDPVQPGRRYTLHVSLDNHPLTYDIRTVRDDEPNEPPPPDLIEVAQNIDDAIWSVAEDENIDSSTTLPHVSIAASGNGTFDYYSFTVERAGATGFFDIDFANFDTKLFLLDADGNLLAENDNGGGDPGSGFGGASYITHRFTSPGTYIVAVGLFFSSYENGQVTGTPPQTGDVYTLHVSLQHRPSVPATDVYSVELTADQRVVVETFTPSPLPGEFANPFDPLVHIYDAQGAILATDDNSAADGRNASLVFQVPASGTYFIEVTAPTATIEGEYVLNIREDGLEGDFDGDGLVAEGDLDLVLAHWGKSPQQLPPEWMSPLPSGIVDQGELDAVLANWGQMSRPLAVASAIPAPAALSQLDVECRNLPSAVERSATDAAYSSSESRRRTSPQAGSSAHVSWDGARTVQPPVKLAHEPGPPRVDSQEAADAFDSRPKRRADAPHDTPHDVVLQLLFGHTGRAI